MIRPVRVAWEFYDACPTCKVNKTEQCIDKRAVGKPKIWPSQLLDRPHKSRVRRSRPMRPIGAHRDQRCRHWHPSYVRGAIPCSLRDHPTPHHLHHSLQYGTVAWTATEQRRQIEYTPRHLRKDDDERHD